MYKISQLIRIKVAYANLFYLTRQNRTQVTVVTVLAEFGGYYRYCRYCGYYSRNR